MKHAIPSIPRPDDIRAHIVAALLAIDGSSGGRTFWEHQHETTAALVEHFRNRLQSLRGYVVIPTGGGKTAIFTSLVASSARIDPNAQPRTILLVPNLNLIGQTLRDFRLNHPDVDISYRASKTIVDEDGVVYASRPSATTVLTYARFIRLVEAGLLTSDDVDLLIMDEAHRGLSDMRQGIISRFFERTAIVAFSATPEFDEDRSLSNLLGDENLVHVVDPQRLRDEGILAPVGNYVLAVGIEGSLPEDPAERTLVKKKAHVDEIISFIEHHVDGRTGLRVIDKATVFYGSNRAHAEMFASEYNRRLGHLGKRMEFLSGKDSLDRIRAVVQGINDGSITGISNAQLLTEGFDLKRLGLVINSPTDSIVKIVQQSGRVQRIDDALPSDDVGQTAFVLDTYMEVDGVMEGHPRWFFETQKGQTAELVSRMAVHASDVDLGDYADLDDVEDVLPDDNPDEGAVQPPFDDGEAPVQTIEETAPETDDGEQPVTGPRTVEVLDEAEEDERIRVEVRDRGAFSSDQSIKTIRYLMAKRALNDSAPEKTEEWLSRSEIASASNADIVHFFDDLEDEFLRKRYDLQLEAEPIVRSWTGAGRTSDQVVVRMELRRSGQRGVVCYHVDCARDLARVSGAALPGYPPSEEWITRNAIMEQFDGTSAVDEVLRECLAQFRIAERLHADPPGIHMDGLDIRMRRISAPSRALVCYHRDSIADILSLASIEHPLPAEGEMSLRDLAERLNISTNNRAIKDAFSLLASQIHAGEPTTINGTPIPCAFRHMPKGAQPFILAEGVEAAVAAMGGIRLNRREDRWELTDDLPVRTDEWLLRSQVFSMLRTSDRPDRPLAQLWDELDATVEIDGVREVERGAFRFRLMRSLNRASTFIHRDDVERFRIAAADPEAIHSIELIESLRVRTDDWLTATMAAQRVRTTIRSPRFASVWTALEKAVLENRSPTYEGHSPSMELMNTGAFIAPCINEAEIPWLEKQVHGSRISTGPKTDQEIGRGEIAARLGCRNTHPKLLQAWQDLETMQENGTSVPGIRMRFVSPNASLAIEEADFPAFLEWYGAEVFDDLQEDHIGREDVMARLKSDVQRDRIPFFSEMWQGIVGADAPAVGDRPVRIARYKANRRRIDHSIHAEDYPILLEGVQARFAELDAPRVRPTRQNPYVPLRSAIQEIGTTTSSKRPSEMLSFVADAVARIAPAPGEPFDLEWEGRTLRLAITPTGDERIHEDDVHHLPLLLDIDMTPSDEQWRSFTDLSMISRSQQVTDSISAIVEEYLQHRRRGDPDHVVEFLPALTESEVPTLEGIPIPEAVPARLRCAVRRRGKQCFVFVHAGDWDEAQRAVGILSYGAHDDLTGYGDREAVFAALGITLNHDVAAAMTKVAQTHLVRLRLTGEDVPVDIDGAIIRCCRARPKAITTTWFHLEDALSIAKLAGYVPQEKLEEDWLLKGAAARALRVNPNGNAVFLDFWDRLSAKALADEPMELGGRVLRTRTGVVRNQQMAYLHADDIAHVAEVLDFVIDLRTPEWLDKTQAARNMGTSISSEPFASTWERMIADREARRDVVIDSAPVRFKKLLSKSRTPYCLHEDDLPLLQNALGLIDRSAIPPKTDDWITAQDFALMHRTQHDQGISEFWSAMADADEQAGAKGTPIRAGMFRNGPHVIPCIHVEDLPAARTSLNLSPPATNEEIAGRWLPRSSVPERQLSQDEIERVSSLWAETAEAGIDATDRGLAALGIRVRFDAHGRERMIRIHADDLDRLLEAVRSNECATAPLN